MTARTNKTNGFTLIEMLVVIGIIAVLGTTAMGSLKYITSARGDSGANGIVAGLMYTTRTEALLHRSTARLVMDGKFDSAKPGNYLRRMVVVTQALDTAGKAMTTASGEPKWKVAGNSVILPGNVFFNPDFSLAHGQMSLDFTNGSPQDQATGPHYYYEFNSVGQAMNATARAQVVLSPGSVGEGTLTTQPVDQWRGFLISRLGRVTYLLDPSEIKKPQA